jgi:hypothetical protein
MPNVIKLLKAIIYERSLISYGVYSINAPGVSVIIDNCSIQDSQVGHGQGSQQEAVKKKFKTTTKSTIIDG